MPRITTESAFNVNNVAQSLNLAASTLGPPPLETLRRSLSIVRELYGCNIDQFAVNSSTLCIQECPVVLEDVSVNSVTLVRAPMGSGKTTALIDWLKSFKDDLGSVIIISCRKSFTSELFRRVSEEQLERFVTYNDVSSYKIDPIEGFRLFIQIESLHRLTNYNYDVVVLDEIMSILSQFFSPTMRRISEVDCAFVKLLTNSKTIIAMDASISKDLVDYFFSIIPTKQLNVVYNQYVTDGFSKRRCCFMPSLGLNTALSLLTDNAFCLIPGSEMVSFCARLIKSISEQKNICVFSATVSFSETVQLICHKVRAKCLLINSNCSDKINLQSWTQYQVLIYTTAVTVGISFDADYFDEMFVYVKPMQKGPDMMSVYQSMGRIRKLSTNMIYIYLDSTGAASDQSIIPSLLPTVLGWSAKLCQTAATLQRTLCDYYISGINSTVVNCFKARYIIEKTALNSIIDSFALLSCLITNNKITLFTNSKQIKFAHQVTELIKQWRDDCNVTIVAKKKIKKIKNVEPAIELRDSQIDSINDFCSRYFSPMIDKTSLSEVLQHLACPRHREHFFNVVMFTVLKGHNFISYSDFVPLYSHYVCCSVPFIKNDVLCVEENGVSGSMLVKYMVHEVTCKLAKIAQLRDCCDRVTVMSLYSFASSVDCSHYVDIASTLISDFYISIQQDEQSYKSYRKELTAQNIPSRTKEEQAIAHFSLLWFEVFGQKVSRVQNTFPIPKKVKDLNKADICKLLSQINIEFEPTATHKSLYKLLMDNKEQFKNQKYYRITDGVNWARYLKSSYDFCAVVPDC